MAETSTKIRRLKQSLHPYTSLLSRMILGGVLLYAGIAKIPYTDTLVWEIEQYRILPGGLATAYGYALPFLEVLLGFLLLSGLALKASASVSGLLVFSFAVAKTTALARGLDIDICPCFGPSVPLLSIHSLAIDLALLALAIYLTLYGSKFLSLGGLFSARKRRGPE